MKKQWELEVVMHGRFIVTDGGEESARHRLDLLVREFHENHGHSIDTYEGLRISEIERKKLFVEIISCEFIKDMEE